MHAVTIFGIKLFEDRLDSELLVRTSGQFLHLYVPLQQLLGKLCFARQQHQKGIAFRFVASRSSNSVYVSISIFGTVNLDNPVHGWEIDATSRDIRAEQHSMLLLYELKVDGRSLILVLLAMELQEVLTHFQRLERLIGKADLLPAGEEDEDLLLLMRLQKAKQRVKLVLDRQLHVVVQQSGGRD